MNIVSNNNRLLSINGGVVPGGGDMWTSGLDYSGNVITGYSGTAFGGVCECDSAAVVNSAFDKTTAWVTGQGYISDTASLDFVQNEALGYVGESISGISGHSFYAISAGSAFESVSALSAGESVSALSSVSAEYAVNAGSADLAGSAEFAGSATSALVSEQSNYSDRAGSAYTAIYDISGNSIYDTYVKNSDLDDLPYVQNTALGIDNNNVTSISGYGVGDFDNLDYVQNTALGIEGDKITAISGYSVGMKHIGSGSVTVTETGNSAIISGKEYDTDIANASSYAFNQATAAIPTGLMYKSAIGSANNTITSYDNVPFAGQGGGHEYTGISPINVNNTTDLISLDNPLQIRGIEPVYITEDANNLYIGCSASGVQMRYTNHDGQTGNVSALNFNSNLDGSLAMTIGGCERNAYLIPQTVNGIGYLWSSGGGKFGTKMPGITCTAFSYPEQTISLTGISANAVLVWCPNDLEASTYTISGRTGYSIVAPGMWSMWVDDHSAYGCILSGNGFLGTV